MENNTIGVVIGRLQPPHIGHKKLIDTALRNHPMALVILGGNGKVDENNPLSFEQRDILLQHQYTDHDLMIDYIEDIESDEAWVKQVGVIVNRLALFDSVTFYAGDFDNDTAITCIKKHEDALLFEGVKYEEFPREKVVIKHEGEQINISATLVRKSIADNNMTLVNKLLSKELSREIIELLR